MYKKYWGLSNLPFQSVPDPDTYFPSPSHEEAIKRITYAIKGGKGGALFIGDIGTGKTMVCRTVVRRLAGSDIDIGVITNPLLDPGELLREMLYQLGITPQTGSKLDLIHKINDKLLANFQEDKKTVIMIDEAHLITDTSILEEIRLLLNFQLNNQFLLTIILIGQPELKRIIQNIPPLAQRLTIKFNLKPFHFEDTVEYILHRLKYAAARRPIFTKDAVKLIYQYTDGIPRRINQVCDLSLLIGSLEKSERVDEAIVKKVIADEHQ